ncbi:molybdopterin-synthase adenylyltransferase MoeB [Yoonia sp. F2084L]|uniref:HesA/MoeB/ThiF family protein n=1 Tax=Yoonia sp. F2084L TaxID=2926419 RepID=UPI001FF216D5|nr:molybdopterin-synthase adenylyltransferase MoeB [Yoonia sp. F2084L]MCK0095172.1 molybdopterin-synthase adenylyltransferase MoeB [Yoonia sp. F2084L]
MIMVGTMAITLWVIGWAMKVPYAVRWNMMAILLVGVMIIHFILPNGHPLRMATGGDARLWAIFFGFGILVWVYRKFLTNLRARVQTQETPAPKSDSFSPTELDRYARHIILREVGGPGQKALRDAKVLVVGAGGLGAPALQYLAAAGVGTIGVIDDDVVENANLQRQVIHLDRNIGMPKVHSAAEAMVAQNPFVTVRPYHRRLEADIAEELFADYDMVLDGTDNFETRYLINKTAVTTGRPLVAAALTQWEGQISVYDPAKGTPCYECVFPEAPDPSLVPSCAEAGVIGPLPGVIGAMMAVEAVKLITVAGDPLAGRLLIYDALYAQTRTIGAKPRADCPVCHGRGLREAD